MVVSGTRLAVYARLLLLSCAVISVAQDKPTSVSCVEVALHPFVPGTDSPKVRLEATVTNNCEKDITAIAMVVRSTASEEGYQKAARDYIACLAYQLDKEISHACDILRRGASDEVEVQLRDDFPDPATAVMAVDTAIFLDRTAAGDLLRASGLMKSRAAFATTYTEEYRLLAQLTNNYEQALAVVRSGHLKASAQVTAAFENMLARLRNSDTGSWRRYVDVELPTLARLALVTKQNSVLAANDSAARR